MNKGMHISIWVVMVLILSIIVGCDEDSSDPIQGYIASDSDFADYMTWNQQEYAIYPTYMDYLGPAHAGNDSSVVRMIYSETDITSPSGSFTQGTIIVKEVFNWNTSGTKDYLADGGLLGMVKRGADFNTAHGGWEWIILDPVTKEITDRGADLMGGACNSCHAAAEGYGGADYVFLHPSELVIPAGDELTFFENSTDWEVMFMDNAPDPLLGMAHGITDSLDRTVLRYQPGAMMVNGEFPVGTVIMKKVTDDMGNYPSPAGGAWTGMIKRGGGFNPSAGDWEWFMMDPVTMVVNDRGALAMCIGCHSAGSTTDYVLSYPW